IAAWITTLGRDRGFGYENTNTIFGIILVVTGLVGTLLGGRISNWFISRSTDKIRTLFLFTAYSAAFGVPCLAVCFGAESAWLFFGACALAELVIFAGTAPLNSLIVLSAPPALVTLTQGVTIATINLIGAFLAPVLVGMVADRSSLPLGLQLTTVSLLGAVVLWKRGGLLRPQPSHAR
ncbi:MAG: hypothetical protein EBZ48_06155, partial [Proteobacteria bacterium]|nr:hypothetical protein [Pseudomonadota bacterium]